MDQPNAYSAEHYDNTPVTEVSKFDHRYVPHIKDIVYRIPAYLKICETVFGLIAYICVEASTNFLNGATFTYFKIVSMFCFWTTLILWGVVVTKMPEKLFRCACLNWIYVELGYYGGVIIFYFFANLFLAIHAENSSHEAGCAFGWFAFVAYLGDLFLVARVFMELRSAAQKDAPQTESSTVTNITTDTRY